ncbi:hypothetical protein A2V82_05055 [candidate division KSB1 bacterium RBG_16_48_16]|nr:MAG: hypothetical protein A2V82_05055 [candidate division KSB1 bacterium RBG_16_48_16]
MKTIRWLLVLALLCVTAPSFSQYADGGLGYMGTEGGLIMGGVGLTKIDDQTYFSINFRPELAFGKFGVGLNVNLLYDTETGHIRSKDWDTGYDYFRMIRYLRYGHKWDKVYARVGTLDAARLGHGFILNYYTNEASYDNRKIGLAFDLDFGRFGFETIASNLGRAELVGGRVYYRPLLGIVTVPIIKNFAVGATYTRDFDPDVWSGTDDGVSVYGFDFELPIIKTQLLNTMLYFDWAQLNGYSSIENESRTFGSGRAIGVSTSIDNLGGLIDLSAKLERRWMGEEFVASFFDPFYEIYRYQEMNGNRQYKTDLLIGLPDTKGVFGELYGGLLGNKVRLLGNFIRLDDQERSGALHLAADAPDAVPTVAAHATYDKIAIEKTGDVFTLDNNSVARVGLGYKIKPYLILYVDYIWTFVETEPGSKTYKPQERIEPKLVFVYNF